ncbi:hypothetical protein [Agrobacterium vitis]|uniref:hypothetical protein n=1 Tax=Agrobacterium vitis TaxID=373 RepID=UPI001AEE17FE|nr:hypothetical protein [Agrobacterium vitis]
MPVKAKKVETGPIPRPPHPPVDDVGDKSTYINSKLTPEEKEKLISSAEQFADILEWGGYDSRFSEAAANVKHYREGNGSDRKLSSDEIRDIETSLPTFSENKNKFLYQFLNDISDQFKNDKNLNVACFILEEKPGDYWLGATAKPSQSPKWHYAMGSFLFSFGARAEVMKIDGKETGLKIKYKVYIYDRYNWDMGKTVSVPKTAIDLADIATPGTIEPLKKYNLGLPDFPNSHYIDTDGDKYVVSDGVMGSLSAANKANFFDIVGETPELYVNYGLER